MKTCLVVDDSGVVRKIARRILEELAFNVSEAGNGQEALDRLEELDTVPELALIDWNMPVMNGLEFVSAVRRCAGPVLGGWGDTALTARRGALPGRVPRK